MKYFLFLVLMIISLSAFSQVTADVEVNGVKTSRDLISGKVTVTKAGTAKTVQHDTSYVFEVDAAFWQKLEYVVSKSNAEHLVWLEVNSYMHPTDPKKNHIKMVVDSVIKK